MQRKLWIILDHAKPILYTKLEMKIKLAQLATSSDITNNKKRIIEVINNTNKDTVVIFPEGMLTGYYPEKENFVQNIDKPMLAPSIEEIAEVTMKSRCAVIFGSISFENGRAYNSSYLTYRGNTQEYRKCNLSTLDRHHFHPGNKLEVYTILDATAGIQMCRENAFPEQWTYLKTLGAKVVFHPNNAVAKYDGKKRHLLISRAMENQIFVVSVNTFNESGPLPSLVINPYGDVIYEAPLHTEAIKELEIDLNEVKDEYLKQKRVDLLHISTNLS